MVRANLVTEGVDRPLLLLLLLLLLLALLEDESEPDPDASSLLARLVSRRCG